MDWPRKVLPSSNKSIDSEVTQGYFRMLKKKMALFESSLIVFF